MAVTTAQVKLSANITEEVAGNVQNNVFNYSIPNLNINLDNNSTPDITEVYGNTLALSGGALTIDLTSLTRTGRTALDLDTLVLHGVWIKNLGANDMTFVEAATDGFTEIFPPTNVTTVKPNGHFFRYEEAATGLGTVSSTNKDITVSGTGTQTFYIALWAGAA